MTQKTITCPLSSLHRRFFLLLFLKLYLEASFFFFFLKDAGHISRSNTLTKKTEPTISTLLFQSWPLMAYYFVHLCFSQQFYYIEEGIAYGSIRDNTRCRLQWGHDVSSSRSSLLLAFLLLFRGECWVRIPQC
jgi:hypothetical protein